MPLKSMGSYFEAVMIVVILRLYGLRLHYIQKLTVKVTSVTFILFVLTFKYK